MVPARKGLCGEQPKCPHIPEKEKLKVVGAHGGVSYRSEKDQAGLHTRQDRVLSRGAEGYPK